MILIWRKKKDEVSNAPINGIITITFFVFLNIASIPLIIMAIFGTSSISFPSFSKWSVVVALVGFAIANYFMLMHKGKSDRIVEKFNALSSNTRKIGMRLTIAYMVISVGILLVIFWGVPPRP